VSTTNGAHQYKPPVATSATGGSSCQGQAARIARLRCHLALRRPLGGSVSSGRPSCGLARPSCRSNCVATTAAQPQHLTVATRLVLCRCCRRSHPTWVTQRAECLTDAIKSKHNRQRHRDSFHCLHFSMACGHTHHRTYISSNRKMCRIGLHATSPKAWHRLKNSNKTSARVCYDLMYWSSPPKIIGQRSSGTPKHGSFM